MKKTTKKLLTVLCASCMAASVGALTACNTDLSNVKDPALSALYEQSKSELSYEEWLKKEFNGKSIATIALSEDGSYYVITYSDGTTENLSATQPKEEAQHVHSYGEEIDVVFAPEGATDGFGYKACACGEKQFVLLKSYITAIEEEAVYYCNFNIVEDGELLAGYEKTVTIKNKSDKVIKYTLTVLDENLSFGEENASTYTVILQAGKSDSVDFILDSSKVNTVGKYSAQIIVSCEEVALGAKENPVTISFKQAVNYKAEIGQDVYFSINFGGELDAATFKFADTVSLEYDGYYYYDWDYENNPEVRKLFYREKGNKDVTNGARIDLSDVISVPAVNSIVKATSTDGIIAFVTTEPVGDSADKSVELALDTFYTGSQYAEVYFTFTPSESGEYVLYSDSMLKWNEPFFEGEKGYFTSNPPVIYDVDSYDEESYLYEKFYSNVYNIIELEANKAFNFMVSGYGYKIKLTKKDANIDYLSGYSEENAIEITLNTETTYSNDVIGEKYYKFTADKAGRVYIDITDTDENAKFGYELYYYDAEDDDWYQYYNVDNPFVEKDDAIMVIVQYLAENALEPSYTLKAEVKELTKVENTFTVKKADGTPVNGVMVTVNEVHGTTDTNGTVKLTFTPGEYEIKLSNLPKNFVALTSYTVWDESDPETDVAQEYEVIIYQKQTAKFVVKFGDTVLENVTVVIKDKKNNVIDFAGMAENDNVTDANGSTKELTFVAADGYKVDLLGLSDEYNFTAISVSSLSIDNGIINLTVAGKPEYVLTLTGLDDWTGVTVSLYRGQSWWPTYVVTGAEVPSDGILKFNLNDANYHIEINGLPEGYTYDEYAVMHKGQRELTLKITGGGFSFYLK